MYLKCKKMCTICFYNSTENQKDNCDDVPLHTAFTLPKWDTNQMYVCIQLCSSHCHSKANLPDVKPQKLDLRLALTSPSSHTPKKTRLKPRDSFSICTLAWGWCMLTSSKVGNSKCLGLQHKKGTIHLSKSQRSEALSHPPFRGETSFNASSQIMKEMNMQTDGPAL